MKKSIVAAFTTIALVFSSFSYAEWNPQRNPISLTTAESMLAAAESPTSQEGTDDTATQRKPVSRAEDSGQKRHSKRWQAWVLAACVVTVAIVALVLASKHHHDHHHD